jgi:hypothetical protein
VKDYSFVFQAALVPLLTLWLSQGKMPAGQALGLEITTTPQATIQQQHQSLFQLCLALHAFLFFVLPRIYQRLKTQWVVEEEQRLQAATQEHDNSTIMMSSTTGSSTASVSLIQHLAQERRRQLKHIFFHLVDMALPILRLGLLLQCWKKGTSPDLGLAVAGLEARSLVVMSSSPASKILYLHVLYAHCQWLHSERARLLPMIVTPLLYSSHETQNMVVSWVRYVHTLIDLISFDLI